MPEGYPFFKPELDGTPTEKPADFVVEHLGGKRFKLVEAFGYWDKPAHPDRPFIAKKDFRNDLSSVPRPVSWVVPVVGAHLPASLLHDALVVGDGEPPTHDGPQVSREEADRIFRDAMRHSGTPRIRRWLVWAAVSLATMWTTRGKVVWRDHLSGLKALAERRPCRWLNALTWPRLQLAAYAVALVFGIVVHLLDIVDTGPWKHPWLGDRPLYVEALVAVGIAVVLPPLAALPLVPRRGRPTATASACAANRRHEPDPPPVRGHPARERWLAGAIFGLTFEVLVVPTVLVAIPVFLLQLAEAVPRWVRSLVRRSPNQASHAAEENR